MEFNARFGDPETQPLMALLGLAARPSSCYAAATGHAGRRAGPPRWKPGAAVAVVMASGGYPESSSQRRRHRRHRDAGPRSPTSHVLHAGTARDADGHLVTAGGRVLAVTAVGADVADARARAYEGVASISFPGAQWRTDIAKDIR